MTENKSKLNADWHKNNKMPKNPTLEERIKWHKAHRQHCACREPPKSLEAYLK